VRIRAATRALSAAALALAALAGAPHAARAAGAAEYGPALFSFVKPGETTPVLAKKLAGEPYLEYDVDVIEGERDVLINAESDEDVDARAEAAGKKETTVHVLEWRNPDDFADAARLVFASGKLWYALLPLTPSESTPEKIEARFGKKPILTSQKRKQGDITYDVRIYSFPDDHTAYVRTTGDHLHHKVRW